MKKTLVPVGVVIALAAVVALASPVFAENVSSAVKPVRAGAVTNVGSSTIASTTLKRAVKLDKVTATLQARADKEMDRRIVALNKLQAKIQEMKKISVTAKSSFATTVQGQINLLNNLKIKINADADAATLKADVQSITKAYRIYALILPQVEIIAAADRLNSTADLLSAYANKLQARVTTAQAGGKDVTALQALLTDMNAKIADAKVQSANAIAGISVLVPDNGDKTAMAANTAALKTARTAINTGTKDVKDANKDGVKIRVGLKSFEKATATSTDATTASTTSE